MLDKKEIMRRKWIMRHNGINVTNDSSWSPNLDAMWYRLPISVRGVELYEAPILTEREPVREELHDARKMDGVHLVRDVVDGKLTGDYHFENDEGLIVNPKDVTDTKKGFTWDVLFKDDNPSEIDTILTIMSTNTDPEYVASPMGDRDNLIHVRSNGKSNGAIPSADMLDAIIFATARSGTDLKTNLGLSALESGAWINPTLYRTPKYSFFNIGNKPEAEQDRSLVNNHTYFNTNDQLKNWRGKLEFGHKISSLLNPDASRYVSLMRYFYEHPNQMKKYDESYDIHNVLSDGFLRYQANPRKWNPGQPNQIKYVTLRADELWASPAILEYINSDHAKEVWQSGLDSRNEQPVETYTQRWFNGN